MNATVSAETPIQRVVEIIEREAVRRFPEAVVDRVIVEEASEFSDDDVLKVSVVLGDPEAIRPAAVVSFIGQLRRLLEGEAGEERFPVVSYFSKGEAAEIFPEAG